MKRIFTLILGAMLLFSMTDSKNQVESETYVYICDSSSATKYHLTSNCRGLNACDHKIIKVTKEDAIKQGKKTLCGWED